MPAKKVKEDPFIQHLMNIHYKFIEHFKKNDLENVAVELNSFNDSHDINELKTALVVTRGLKEHPKVKNARARVLEIYEKKSAPYKDEE